MIWRNSLGLALLAALGTPVVASAQAAEPRAEHGTARPLTEADVVALAVRESPGVLAARQEATAAAAESAAADRLRFPDLVVSGRYTRLSSIPARYRTLSLPSADGAVANVVIPEHLDNFTARAALVVPLTDAWLSLAANARAQGELSTAKRIEVQAAQARAAFEARAAFLLHRRAQVALHVSQSALETISAQANDQENRVRAGTAPGSSALTFEAARNAAIARVRLAEAEVVASEASVRVFLPTALANAPLVVDAVPRRVEVHQQTVERAPTLLAADAAVRAADTRAEAEQLAMLPRISVVGGVELSAPNPRAFAMSNLEAVPSWDVSVQLDWSLSSLTTGISHHDRAVAEREALRARAEEIRRTLEAQRRAAVAARSSADARARAARQGVTTASQLANARRSELAVGIATPLDVTTAEAEYIRAQLEAADAELDLHLADARIEYAVGKVPTIDAP